MQGHEAAYRLLFMWWGASSCSLWWQVQMTLPLLGFAAVVGGRIGEYIDGVCGASVWRQMAEGDACVLLW